MVGLAPGSVVVENYPLLYQNYDRDAHQRAIPAGFVADPDDIANAALFLASESARYIVGQTLIADGGTTAWMAFGEGHKDRLSAAGDIGYLPTS